ncbi:hypothetical protein SAMN02745181_1262 [Rubritalea squalenifaciens DSM 18772]|uniref:DUF91 domain-containing protein n=1 Tax=Rubritalea squalenifaciens DSM 18772 TaxID=1123071 RepID=A0A1M6GTF0_9BACT|nr:hypothetical protein [Rubritalea squalenifaciens]SHJ13231.1 hypothetical protein SAMN02745181_1262 [Rubritalea squalenifaciens DSM 18772]
MLYRIIKDGDSFESLEPQPFTHLPLEKDLENLLADQLMESLELLPFFQERARQEEADIYALNKNGDIVIFELKRATVGGDAVHQVLRYADQSADWNYSTIAKKFETYRGQRDNLPSGSLAEAHQETFELDEPLAESSFNKDQHLILVGYAGNTDLAKKVDYWKGKGLKIDFVPYRIFEIADESYFEFFSLPYDLHQNPAHLKGVIFDTCLMNGNWSLEYMARNSRVAAYNEQDGCVYRLNKNDTVFLYHKGVGIVAAGRVTSAVKDDPDFDAVDTTKYCDLEWLTPVPNPDNPQHISAREIRKLLGHGFFWARTVKTPYLTREESETLVAEMNRRFN